MLNRRQFLVAGAAISAVGLISTPVDAALRTSVDRSVSLHNIHTGESLHAVYWHNGRYQTAVLGQISHLMRDHYSGAVHPIDPHVIDLLSVIQNRFGKHRPLQLISGYRTPRTNAMLSEMSDGVASHSLHMVGKAADIRIEGISVQTLGRAARSLRRGGVGQYPASDFVHVDVGSVRYW